MGKLFDDSNNYMDKVQEENIAEGEGPHGESQSVSRHDTNVAESPESDAVQVDVQEAEVYEEGQVAPDAAFPEAHQVEPTYKIFVPFEDFEGRVNQEDFSFKKDVAVKVTADQANTWLDAKKGYVK